VGSGEPGKALKTQSGQEVKGGLVGLIIDARGRPLRFPLERDARYIQSRRWWSTFDAIPANDPLSSGPFTLADRQAAGADDDLMPDEV
jgi:hypothetical protein